MKHDSDDAYHGCEAPLAAIEPCYLHNQLSQQAQGSDVSKQI